LTLLTACPPSEPDPPEAQWRLVHEDLDGALLSVWGTSSTDVWAVGADTRDGKGPLVIHYDGEAWTRVETGLTQGDLWWVFGFEGGPIYMGGDGGVIVEYDGDQFSVMDTPGDLTVFGIWGSSPTDMWAVGGASDATGGFAWRLNAGIWEPEPTVPADVESTAALWKVYGFGADDAWIVGSNGVALRWNDGQLTHGDTGVGSSLFTVHGHDGEYVAVGGLASGVIVENADGTWKNVTPDPLPMGLSGVAMGEDGTGIAVGLFGGLYVRENGAWRAEDAGLGLAQNLHGAWIDDKGELWAVGGQTLSPPLTDGVLIHWGLSEVSPEGL
jgi:hypothetical protein